MLRSKTAQCLCGFLHIRSKCIFQIIVCLGIWIETQMPHGHKYSCVFMQCLIEWGTRVQIFCVFLKIILQTCNTNSLL